MTMLGVAGGVPRDHPGAVADWPGMAPWLVTADRSPFPGRTITSQRHMLQRLLLRDPTAAKSYRRAVGTLPVEGTPTPRSP